MIRKVVLAVLDLLAPLFRKTGLDYPSRRAILDVKLSLDNRRAGSALYRNVDRMANNALLLDRAEDLPDRSCRFVCCMVVVLTEVRFLAVQETCEGVLGVAPRGAGGFGYDPVFFLPEYGCTMAQLSQEEKNRISHRARAIEAALPKLRALLAGGALA